MSCQIALLPNVRPEIGDVVWIENSDDIGCRAYWVYAPHPNIAVYAFLARIVESDSSDFLIDGDCYLKGEPNFHLHPERKVMP
jgi:hypothetical protein